VVSRERLIGRKVLRLNNTEEGGGGRSLVGRSRLYLGPTAVFRELSPREKNIRLFFEGILFQDFKKGIF